jgi:CRP-like cAMP-binding protein
LWKDWLVGFLMVDDRTDGDQLRLTHEFLSVMLATRRPGVTVALKTLKQSRTIEQSRGQITILNRQALEEIAGSTYRKTL